MRRSTGGESQNSKNEQQFHVSPLLWRYLSRSLRARQFLIMMHVMKRYGKLDVVEVENGRELCVVLFHGFGADAHDLAPLSDVSSQIKATWIFPNAGLQVPIAPGFMGRAWFHIDVAALD